MIAEIDLRLAEIETREAAELLTSFWGPDETIEAVTAACETLAAAGSSRGIVAATCPQ